MMGDIKDSATLVGPTIRMVILTPILNGRCPLVGVVGNRQKPALIRLAFVFAGAGYGGRLPNRD
jgi:hypothetical protein